MHYVSKHIRALVADLSKETVCSAWQPLFTAGQKLGTEIADALDSYFVTLDTEKLNRELITSAIVFVDKWELWINSLRYGSLQSRATKTLHEFFLRFAKGALKAWRIWRIDTAK